MRMVGAWREWINSNNNATAYLNQIKADFNNIIKFSSGLYLKQKIKSSNQYFV